MLRLVHLSDIHFGGYGEVWDDKEDQRDQLTEDVARLVAEDGSADAILIGGDIAFSGKRDEYDRARKWLDELVTAADCDPSSIWMVPGNHDVDQAVIKRSPILEAFHRDVQECGLDELDELLKRRMAQDEAAVGLVAPFTEYTKFARKYGCPTSAHTPYWHDDSLQTGSHAVQLWGVNSAVVSGLNDGDPPKSDPTLVLGTHQSRMKEPAGVLRLALCHHPPSHLRDWDRVAPYFARAHVCLFGHVHAYRTEQRVAGGGVHVHAGAVGPPAGGAWGPTYNFLSLEVGDESIQLEVRPRVWSESDKLFEAHHQERETFTIALDRRTLLGVPEPEPAEEPEPEPLDDARPTEEEVASATPLARSPEQVAEGSEAEVSPERLRQLAVGYFGAPVTRRLEIAQALGVLEEADHDLPDRERSAAVLTRIRDRGLIDELAEELGL